VRNLTALQDRPVEVRGQAPWATRVDAALPRPPFTVLCRTNAGVVGAVVATHEVHRGRVHVVGGVEELVHLLRDAALLKKGERRTDPHPDLTMVETWEELEALAEAGYAPAYGVLRKLEGLQLSPDLLRPRLRGAAPGPGAPRPGGPGGLPGEGVDPGGGGRGGGGLHRPQGQGKGVGPGGPLGRLLPLVGGGGGGEGQLGPGPGPFPPVLCSSCMRLTVHIPEDLARLLRQAAENEGKSMSALTAEALEAYLKERRRRALGLKVLERAGRSRVAEEAHRLLEEGRRDRP